MELSNSNNTCATHSLAHQNGKTEFEFLRIMVIMALDLLTPNDENQPRIGNPISVCPEEVASNGVAAASSYQANPVASSYQANPVASSYQPAPTSNSYAPPNPVAYAPNPTNSYASTSYAPPPSNLDTPIHPIKSLNPYQNKWTIKARAISKSAIKTWNNARGEGKLFSVTFVDESVLFMIYS